MTTEATGTYVNTQSEETPLGAGGMDASISRGSVRREFTGDIVGASVADVMIVRGAADRLGYVATDRFTGRVGGRAGTFVFQHGGTIDRGKLTPFGYIVPGSGTGELEGLTGEVRIQFIPPATHAIMITYTL